MLWNGVPKVEKKNQQRKKSYIRKSTKSEIRSEEKEKEKLLQAFHST